MGATSHCGAHVLCRIEHQPLSKEPEVSANPLKTIAIACVLVCVMAVLLFEIQTQVTNSAGAITEIQHNVVAPAPRATARPLDTNSDFQTSEFYRTIVDNNLFRPLGWRPPSPIESYRLLGTVIGRDANTPPRAIIQTTAGHQTYIVSTGERLDVETEIVAIAAKQVTLEKAGQRRTLKLNTTLWLK